MTIAVVGGGPAGLLTSYYLTENNCDVTLFEEHFQIGYPKHCTGLVSYKTLREIPIDLIDCVEKVFEKVIIHSTNNTKDSLEIKIQPVVKIDRPCIEKRIFDEIKKKNVIIRLGEKILLEKRKNHLVLKNHGVNYDLLIDARGTEGFLRKNEKARNRTLVGLNLVVKTRNKLSDDTLHVFFNNDLTPQFFSWAFPLRKDEVIIGGGFVNNNSINSLLHYFVKNAYLEKPYLIKEKYGGIILRGPPIHTFYGENWVGIGDSIGLVKPVTGGGLYPIISSIPFERKNQDCLDAINQLINNIATTITKLRKQYYLSRIIHSKVFPNLLQKYTVISRFIGTSREEVFLDYDEHEKNIFYLLKHLFFA